MLTTIRLYREYRRQGLRRAWSLSGMTDVALLFARYVAIGAVIAASLIALSNQAQAIQDDADSRVAARIANQSGEIDALRTLLAACLGDRDGILWVGDEAHLCRAVPTGIRK